MRAKGETDAPREALLVSRISGRTKLEIGKTGRIDSVRPVERKSVNNYSIE